MAQQPQYQHSSGCRIIGGLPATGCGIYTSIWHVSTQMLHPSQTSGLKMTGLFGVVTFGMANNFSLDTVSSKISSSKKLVSMVKGGHFTLYTPV